MRDLRRWFGLPTDRKELTIYTRRGLRVCNIEGKATWPYEFAEPRRARFAIEEEGV